MREKETRRLPGLISTIPFLLPTGTDLNVKHTKEFV